MNPLADAAEAYAKQQMELVLTIWEPSATLGRSREALENRLSTAWIDGYIQGVTAGMPNRESLLIPNESVSA